MAEIRIHPAAEAEYEAALERYLTQNPRAAARFEVAIDEALEKIAENPLLYGLCDESHRFYLLKRFPYSLIYRVETEQVILVALAHTHRKPGFWSDRKFAE